MIKEKMLNALNRQVNAEFYAAYLYLSMAAHCEAENLPGFANWLKMQTQEEVFHAMKIYGYILERGEKVKLTTIEEPKIEWKDLEEIFSAALGHEQKVTAMINDLVDLSIEISDHATKKFLDWFVEEQVEEEAAAGDVLNKVKMVKDAPGAIFMLDNQMGQRTFTPPTAAKE